jgi:hypothetical protein
MCYCNAAQPRARKFPGYLSSKNFTVAPEELIAVAIVQQYYRFERMAGIWFLGGVGIILRKYYNSVLCLITYFG